MISLSWRKRGRARSCKRTLDLVSGRFGSSSSRRSQGWKPCAQVVTTKKSANSRETSDGRSSPRVAKKTSSVTLQAVVISCLVRARKELAQEATKDQNCAVLAGLSWCRTHWHGRAECGGCEGAFLFWRQDGKSGERATNWVGQVPSGLGVALGVKPP